MKLHYNCKILLFVFSVLVSACSSKTCLWIPYKWNYGFQN